MIKDDEQEMFLGNKKNYFQFLFRKCNVDYLRILLEFNS